MLIFKQFWLFLLIGSWNICFSQSITYYDLSIEFDVENKTIIGSNEIHIKEIYGEPTFELELDSALAINSLSILKGEKWVDAHFSRLGNTIEINTAKFASKTKTLVIKITYSGKPREALNPPWQGGFSWEKSQNGQDWIGVSCQVQGADIWWPCKKDWKYEPDSMQLHFTAPSNLKCISNGTLIDKTIGNKTTSWHWKITNPINPYGVTVNLGTYLSEESEYSSINGTKFPIELWYLEENKDKALAFFPQINQQLTFLENLLGAYPFSNEKYAVVEAPYTGMEHQTAISIDTLYRNNYVGFNWLHFHELSHEWWGNLVTASFEDLWIHEGFAKYMEALYVEEQKGTKHYSRFIKSYYDRMLNMQPIAYHQKMEADDAYFIKTEENIVNRDYSLKGAYFLHLLRMEMGDSTFFEWMTEIINPPVSKVKKRFRHVTTNDLLQLANQLLEKKLDSLFDSVLYHAKMPDAYEFSELDCMVSMGSKKERIEYMTGQMLLVGFYGTSIDRSHELSKNIRNGRIGGVVIYERNISEDSSIETLTELTKQLQSMAPAPLFVTIDEEGGKVNRLKTKYGFPPTVSATYLGNIDNSDSTAYYSESTAMTLQKLGINVNFAPVADLCSNPDNPIIAGVERCYSEKPIEVFQHDSIVISSHKKYEILPVMKHFPGHGSSSKDSHLGIVNVTRSWKKSELIPYQKLIEQNNCPAIMTAHIKNAHLDSIMHPATLSYSINQILLRDSMGFKGLVFSDDLQMKAISQHYSLEETLILAINSSVDVLMFSHNIEGTTDYSIEEIHETLVELVLSDKISIERIEESYGRIMRLKNQWKKAVQTKG